MVPTCLKPCTSACQLSLLPFLRAQAWEAQRVRYLEAENARLWRSVEVAGLEAAGTARIEYRWVEYWLRAESAAALQPPHP